MHLNSTEESAIALIAKALKHDESPIAQNDADLKRILVSQHYSGKSSPPRTSLPAVAESDQPQMFTAVNFNFSDIVASTVPKIITPDLKKNLEILDEFVKAGEQATPEQKKAAIAAYKALGRGIKLTVTTEILKVGIIAGLANLPYVGPVSTVIANIAAKPLAEMSIALNEKYLSVAEYLINIALTKMKRQPIAQEDMDIFMAKTIGNFAGTMLEEINRREATTTPAADKARANLNDTPMTSTVA